MFFLKNFTDRLLDVFSHPETDHTSRLKIKLTTDFFIFLIGMSVVAIFLYSFPGYKPFFLLALPVMILLIVFFFISLKLKKINLLAWSGLTILFLMLNIGIVISGGNINMVTILWSITLVVFSFFVLGSKVGIVTLCIQFFIFFFFLEIKEFGVELNFLKNFNEEFHADILTLLFPLFLIFYFIYHFIKTDNLINRELILANEQLKHFNTLLHVQNKAYASSQKNLSESEKQFRLISDKSRDLICVCSPESIIKYISPSSVELLKIKSKHMVHKKFCDYVYNQDINRISSLFETINKNENIDNHIQFRMVKSDGNYIWFDSIFQPVYNSEGELIQIQSISRDITAIKKHEDSLRLFSDVINETEEAILIADSNSNIVYVNRETAEMYGFTIDEMMHLSIIDIDSFLNDSNKWAGFIEDLRSKTKISKEVMFLKPDGTCTSVEERWQYTVVEGNGYVIKLISDIQDRKKAEMKIRKNLERQSILSEIAFILNTSDNFDFKVNEALRIVGNFLKVSRVLMFQNILNGKAVSCTYEWYNSDSLPQMSELQAIPYSMISSIKEKLEIRDIFVCDDIVSLPMDISTLFKPYNIFSLIIVPLKIGNNVEGFLCIVDNLVQHSWHDGDKRFINTFIDITCNSFRQKKALESLIQSEKRFRELAELLPEMVCEAGINGKITFANKHTQVQFGFDENDLQKGKIFFNLFTSADRLRILENFERILRSENIDNEEYNIINREGNEVPVLVYINVIMKEHLPVGLRAVMIDISERKMSENQLVTMARLTEESPIAFLRLDKNGEIVYANKEASIIKDFIFANYSTHFSELINSIVIRKESEELEIEVSGTPFIINIYPDKDSNYINICGKKKIKK